MYICASRPSKRAEAKEYDTNAIGVYVIHERPDADNYNSCWPCTDRTIALMLTFSLQANVDNLLTATVTGKRKREVGLVVLAKFTAFTQELKNAKILKRELNERTSRFTHFELKNITIDENQESAPVKINYSEFLSPYGNTRITYWRAALINFSTPRYGA